MIVRRRCVSCLAFWDVDETEKNNKCPKCRSATGRAKQKVIQKAAKKKRKAGRKCKK